MGGKRAEREQRREIEKSKNDHRRGERGIPCEVCGAKRSDGIGGKELEEQASAKARKELSEREKKQASEEEEREEAVSERRRNES